MKHLIISAALIVAAFGAQAQELREAGSPSAVAPVGKGFTKEAMYEKATSLKQLHGEVGVAMGTLDRQMAATTDDGKVAISQRKEKLAAMMREIEQAIGAVSAAGPDTWGDVERNADEVAARAKALVGDVGR